MGIADKAKDAIEVLTGKTKKAGEDVKDTFKN